MCEPFCPSTSELRLDEAQRLPFTRHDSNAAPESDHLSEQPSLPRGGRESRGLAGIIWAHWSQYGETFMNQHFHILFSRSEIYLLIFILFNKLLCTLCPYESHPSFINLLFFSTISCCTQIRTMKANYTIEAGDVRVIRPLVYVREKSTRDFSQESRLPIINENCPACFEQPKERDRVKKLLVQEESMIPNLFYNLKRALVPLMDDAVYDVMASVAAAADARGRNPQHRLPQRMIQSQSGAAAGADEVDEDTKEESGADNKRKRPAPSWQGQDLGPGPGMFGSSSNLTNGKNTSATAAIATATATTAATAMAVDDDHATKKTKNSPLTE
jgi:hypothetical protein